MELVSLGTEVLQKSTSLRISICRLWLLVHLNVQDTII